MTTAPTAPGSIPTLTTVDDATALLAQLAEAHDWVSVFWDRGWGGWGDSGQTTEITVVIDGNGDVQGAKLADANDELAARRPAILGLGPERAPTGDPARDRAYEMIRRQRRDETEEA